MSLAPAGAPATGAPPPMSGAPPGAPPPVHPFKDALADEWARTAQAEGQQKGSPKGPAKEAEDRGHRSARSAAETAPLNGLVPAGSTERTPAAPRAAAPARTAPGPSPELASDAPAEPSPAPGGGSARPPATPDPAPATKALSPEGPVPARATLASDPAAAARTPGTPPDEATPPPVPAGPAAAPTGPAEASKATAGSRESTAGSRAGHGGADAPEQSSAGSGPSGRVRGDDAGGVSGRPTAASSTATAGQDGALAQITDPRSPARTAPGGAPAPGASASEAAPVQSVLGSPAPGATAAAPVGTAAPAPSASGVQMQDMIESIHATIQLAAGQGASQARISLEPAELGEIRIHLTQTGDGLLARVTADTPAAAQALAAGRGELHEALSSLGTTLLRLDIGSSGLPEGRAERQAPTPQRSSRRSATTDDEESIDAAQAPVPSGTGPTQALGELVDVLA